MMENLDLATIGPLLTCGVVGLFLGFLLGRRGSGSTAPTPLPAGGGGADRSEVNSLIAAKQASIREASLLRAEVHRLRRLEAGGGHSGGNHAELKDEIEALRAWRTKSNRDLKLMRAELTRLRRLEEAPPS